jgi:TolA-binding protein
VDLRNVILGILAFAILNITAFANKFHYQQWLEDFEQKISSYQELEKELNEYEARIELMNQKVQILKNYVAVGQRLFEILWRFQSIPEKRGIEITKFVFSRKQKMLKIEGMADPNQPAEAKRTLEEIKNYLTEKQKGIFARLKILGDDRFVVEVEIEGR